jgi:hypothetical protein
MLSTVNLAARAAHLSHTGGVPRWRSWSDLLDGEPRRFERTAPCVVRINKRTGLIDTAAYIFQSNLA